MVDFAAVLNGFHMDETRMFAIDAMPDKAMRACEDAIDIHDFILEKAGPGISTGELFQLALERADSLGCSHSFLGAPGSKVRFIGHGIGHELVEPPIIAQGKWCGRILTHPQGEQGFGYDPLFFIEEQQLSAAELDPSTKNRISHRGRAMAHLLQQLVPATTQKS